MRDAFGGAFMIKLVIVFIVIYVSFMAVAVNYAKTFRVKNRVIDILEQNQYGLDGSNKDTVRGKVSDYLKSVSYAVPKIMPGNCNSNNYVSGVCIEPVCSNEHRSKDTTNSCYYIVTAYITADLPFFKLNPTLPIKGETITIEY